MSFYKYVSAENGLKILDGTIRFTQPNAFNDPFELVPEFYCPDELGDIEIEFDILGKDDDFKLSELDDF